jgi:NAD(P)-dependent dehydrogenase (short-subunit alcohol dehydrogenase family)
LVHALRVCSLSFYSKDLRATHRVNASDKRLDLPSSKRSDLKVFNEMGTTIPAVATGRLLPQRRKMLQQNRSVWFITGCSTGLGREMAKLVLNRDYRAVVTARDPQKIHHVIAGRAGQALALKLDVTDAGQIADVVQKVEEKFGSIDVLVNNLGYDYMAAIEESEDAEIRAMFEVNFFGVARLIHAVLPGMRQRRRGHIINVSSIAGFVGFASAGYYTATKFAVEGLSEVLAKEVAPFGVKVLIVESRRSEFAGYSLKRSRRRIDDYAETIHAYQRYSISQVRADPVRAVEAVIKVIECPTSPLRLVLGKAALETARAKLALLRGDFDASEVTSVGAEFQEPIPGTLHR